MPLASVIAEAQAAAAKILPSMNEDDGIKIMVAAQLINVSRETAVNAAGAIMAAIAWDDEVEAAKVLNTITLQAGAIEPSGDVFGNLITSDLGSEGNADATATEQTDRRRVDRPIGELGIEGDRRTPESGTGGDQA